MKEWLHWIGICVKLKIGLTWQINIKLRERGQNFKLPDVWGMISCIRASYSKDWMGNAVKSVTLWASRQNGLLMPRLIVACKTKTKTAQADHPDTQSILQTMCLCLSCKAKVKVAALWQTAYSVKTWQISALLSVSLSLGLSRAINIFHWCLVRSGPFTGTARFLASLFTFLSRWPTGSELVKSIGSKLSSWQQQKSSQSFLHHCAYLWNAVSPIYK